MYAFFNVVNSVFVAIQTSASQN